MRIVVALVVSALVMFASPAHAGGTKTHRIEPPKRHVAHVKVVKINHAGPGIKVRFNTRSLWRVMPCRYEDSNNCYWDARNRGNGRGTSFVVIRGKYYPLTA